MLKRTLCGLMVAFLLGSCGTTTDRHDAALQPPSQAALDLLQIEADECQAMIEWQQAVQRINAETNKYEAALEAAMVAAMVARRETGDYGEVYE